MKARKNKRLQSLEEKVEHLTKKIDRLNRRGSMPKLPKDFTAVAEVSDPSLYAVSTSPVDFKNLFGNAKTRRIIEDELPFKLDFKPTFITTLIRLFKLLTAKDDHDFITELFNCTDLKALASAGAKRRVMLHYTDKSAIEAEAMGTFWAYLINSQTCFNNKKQIEAFVQCFFFSKGGFSGVYKSLTGSSRSVDHADFHGNSLAVAFRELRKEKSVSSITEEKVNNQPLVKYLSSQK